MLNRDRRPWRRRVTTAIVVALVSILLPTAAQRRCVLAADNDVRDSWIVSAETARGLIDAGAVVLDAREPLLKGLRPLPGATSVRWESFSQPDAPNQGLLLEDDAALTRRLQDLGVSAGRAVVVVADPIRGWGEDGRIVWMLRTLGHAHAVLIDGGIEALAQGGYPRIKAPAVPGDFVVRRDPRWLADREQVHADLGAPKVVFVDVREPREFAGETPYGERRGGHLPGARPLYYKELLNADGRLLPRPELVRLLGSRGVDGDEVIAYCTGGVRAAWFTSVLNDLGVRVKNYAGSMWEWSAQPAAAYPLTTTVE